MLNTDMWPIIRQSCFEMGTIHVEELGGPYLAPVPYQDVSKKGPSSIFGEHKAQFDMRPYGSPWLLKKYLKKHI